MTKPTNQGQAHIRCLSDFIVLVAKRMKNCVDQNQRRCSERIDEGRISTQEFSIMLALTEYGTMPVKDIAAKLHGVSLSTLTRMLDKLETSGLITRTLDPHDRRSFLISATDKARAVEEDYKQQVDGMAESMLAGLDSDERLIFIRLLSKIRLQLKGEQP